MTRPARVVRCAVLCSSIAACASAAACHRTAPTEPFLITPRYWLQSDSSAVALSMAVQRLRSAVYESFSDGVLDDGFPRGCTVTEPQIRTRPFVSECVEGGGTPDAILLDAEGSFIQFVPIDYLSARAFLFQIYLIPDERTAEGLTPQALRDHPFVAIPHLELSERTYRQWLSAVMRGVRAAGAEPLPTR